MADCAAFPLNDMRDDLLRFLEGPMNTEYVPDTNMLNEASMRAYPLQLLKAGVCCIRQGQYTEGLVLLKRLRDIIQSDQAHIIDAFIQYHQVYIQAQTVLFQSCKHFTQVDAEWQARIEKLEHLLTALLNNVTEVLPAWDRESAAQAYQRLPAFERLIELSDPFPISHPAVEQSNRGQLLSPANDSGAELSPLYITCFGHFAIKRCGKPVELCGSRNGQRILRYLIAQPGYSATNDALVDILWPEDETEVAQRKLHIAISALRRSLNDGIACKSGNGYILFKNGIYLLNPAAPIQTDVDEFLRCYQMGKQREEEQIALYERSCRLYTGPFLAEDRYADWSFLRREHLNQIYLSMCRTLSEHYLHARSYGDAEKWAVETLKENQCDEAAHLQLMQIYIAQSRRTAAIQQYQRCKHVLQEELGVQPMPQIVALFRSMLDGDPPDPNTKPSSADKEKI